MARAGPKQPKNTNQASREVDQEAKLGESPASRALSVVSIPPLDREQSPGPPENLDRGPADGSDLSQSVYMYQNFSLYQGCEKQ
jgi:hypothetical protein